MVVTQVWKWTEGDFSSRMPPSCLSYGRWGPSEETGLGKNTMNSTGIILDLWCLESTQWRSHMTSTAGHMNLELEGGLCQRCTCCLCYCEDVTVRIQAEVRDGSAQV